MDTKKWKSKWEPHVMTDQEIRDYLNGALGYKGGTNEKFIFKTEEEANIYLKEYYNVIIREFLMNIRNGLNKC